MLKLSSLDTSIFEICVLALVAVTTLAMFPGAYTPGITLHPHGRLFSLSGRRITRSFPWASFPA